MTGRRLERISILAALLAGLMVAAISPTPLCAGGFNPNAPSFGVLFDAFNENYRQALYATQQGEKKRSSAEVAATRLAWGMLLLRYSETPPQAYRKDPRWQADLATISGYIDAAHAQLEAGNIPEAHATLEPIRRLWVDINQRNGVRRFGDELVRFHDVMEPLVQSAVAGVDESSIAEFRKRLDALVAGWRQVQHFGFAPKRAEDRKRFKEMVAAESLAIDNLAKATKAKDYPGIASLAPKVKDAFAKLYLEFG